MSGRFTSLCAAALLLASIGAVAAPSSKDLCLIPFPKQVRLESGTFALKPSMALTVTDTTVARQAADDLRQELKRVANATCNTSFVTSKSDLPAYWLLLCAPNKARAADIAKNLSAVTDKAEGYRLIVRPGYAAVGARDKSGLVWGIQTLLQLVRANMNGQSIPCLTIDDWPSLAHRGFQDDITRGPSPKLETLELESRMASLLKLNFQTYYIEHQYAFNKYPDIGPADGSLTPDELVKLVDYAAARNVDVIGSQQSFGHWATILRNEKYKHLSETGWAVNPLLEETYQMLDNMYSEQVPLTRSPFFNVNCDEIGRLGPSACELARQIGVGGVYAKHITRLHDLLRDKYHKRMMMWGDIILSHPENLKDIPADTVVLTWDYGDRVSYENKVVPFEKVGFEFWVCPTTTCWSMLPDFGFAVDNIQGFVRDGVKHGATGVLNTTWDDNAESFFGFYWHGIAWGAECAWNAAATPIDDFNRRIGPVLFADRDNHFGKAISILMQTHKQHIDISTSRFWRTAGLPSDKEQAKKQANELLAIVEPALKELRLARGDAKVNADQLDYVIFGAERMKCLATRALSLLDASDSYAKALSADSEGAAFWVQSAIKSVTAVRDEHTRLKSQFKLLWDREEKPYSLDWTLRDFDKQIAGYDKILAGLDTARIALNDGKPLPAAKEIGL